MESTVKSALGAPVSQLLCCISADFPKEKDAAFPTHCGRNRAQEQPQKKSASQKQKSKRDAAFAQQKAQRATMRAQLREKYKLPKNRTDKKQMDAAGGVAKLPQDLLAIIKPKGAPDPSSILSNFKALDFSSLRLTAGNAVQSLQRPVQCPVM